MIQKRDTRTGYQKGLRAEWLAGWYLRFKGYRILALRYKTHLGEIDIVAARGKTVVFVEVKQRSTQDRAKESIHAENQARVRRAAELYLQKYPRYTGHDVRFDAIVFAPGAWPQHLQNVF